MSKNWLDIVGSVKRPQLGEDVPILIFRAFRIYSGEYLRDLMGEKGAVVLFQNAGRELGRSLGEKLISDSITTYLENVRTFMKESKIGLLIPEDLDEHRGVFKIDECITCSGIPNIGSRICHFEAGFVAGILEFFTKKRVKATETKCNAMGEGVCEVTVEIENAQGK